MPFATRIFKHHRRKYFKFRSPFLFVIGGGGRALECNMTGRCPFLRISTTCLGKTVAFLYHVSGLLDYKIFRRQ